MWGSSLPPVLTVPLTNIHAFTSGLLTDEELTTSHSLSLPTFLLELPLFLFSVSSFATRTSHPQGMWNPQRGALGREGQIDVDLGLLCLLTGTGEYQSRLL